MRKTLTVSFGLILSMSAFPSVFAAAGAEPTDFLSMLLASAPEGEVPSTPLPQGEGMRQRSWRFNGYFRSEYKYQQLNVYQGYDDRLGLWMPRGSPYLAFGLLSSAAHEAYAEVNFEARWKRLHFFSLYTDTSFVTSTVVPQQSMFEQALDALIGAGIASPSSDVSGFDMGVPIPGTTEGPFVRAAEDRVQINELYASLDVSDWVSMTFGKRRVVWGSAFTWAPMDVANPPFNPLEPTLLREGSYNVTASLVHFDKVSATLLYRPLVTENEWGIPTKWDFTKNLFIGRLYLNVLESDVNLAAYLHQGRPYGGVSFSRYFNLIELHMESLLQRGRPTWLVRPSSNSGDTAESSYAPYELGQFDIDACQADGPCKVTGDILLGARYAFDDGSFALLEYLFHGPGYNREEYEDYHAFTAYMEEVLPHLVTEPSVIDPNASDAAKASWTDMVTMAPLLYQGTNVRHNYLSFSFLKSQMYDLVEPKITAIWDLDDFSFVLYPSVDFVLARGLSGPGTARFTAGLLMFLGSSDSQVFLYPSKYTANLRLTVRF